MKIYNILHDCMLPKQLHNLKDSLNLEHHILYIFPLCDFCKLHNYQPKCSNLIFYNVLTILHNATAFHFLTSNIFSVLFESII